MAGSTFDAKSVVDRCREAFNTGKTRSYESRIRHLHNLRRMIAENKEAFFDAAHKDMRKPKFEMQTLEVDFSLNECIHVINDLENWMKPEKVGFTMVGLGKQTYIHREPLGVVLIIGAWNYPFQLIVHPLVGAIAAGNTVVIKPSEISPASAKVVEELIPKYMDSNCFQVVNGDIPVTTALLEQKFDHIMYTGGGGVAKIVLAAAAKYLTPVTLELGGKCPLYLDSNCNIDIAMHRCAWAKFLNSGQSCIAPDYIICRLKDTDRVVASLKKCLQEFFTADPKKCPDFGRMVNVRHFKRVLSMLDGLEVVIGGESDESELYIAPAVVVNPKHTDRVMQEEIFGPILPIINMESVDEAIKFVNSRDKPLASYVFSSDRSVIDRFQNETSSGALCGNECFVHGGVETLPFGGVGGSGMGSYHGRFSFETFSHRKSCLVDPAYRLSEAGRTLFYPPYTDRKKNIIAWALGKKLKGNSIMSLLFKLAGAVIILAVLYKLMSS